MDKIVEAVKDCLQKECKIIAFGCGGNALNAMHLAAELSGKFEEFENPLPCIDLCSNPAVLTAITNDFGWDVVFSRQIKALANPGDVVIAFSISGEGEYLVNALKEAKSQGCMTVLVNGSIVDYDFVDILLALDSEDTPKVQEWQLGIVHQLCRKVKSEVDLDD